MSTLEVGWRGDLSEPFFHVIGAFARRQSGSVADPKDMGVHSDGRVTESLIEHHIGGFAAHTGQTHQRVSGLGYFAVKLLQDHAGQGNDILRFVAEQADSLDMLSHLVLAQSQHFLRCIGQPEQCIGGLVDSYIGGLGG